MMMNEDEDEIELQRIEQITHAEAVLTGAYRGLRGCDGPAGIDARDWLKRCRISIEFENGEDYWWSGAVLRGVDLRPDAEPRFDSGIDAAMRAVLRELSNRTESCELPLD